MSFEPILFTEEGEELKHVQMGSPITFTGAKEQYSLRVASSTKEVGLSVPTKVEVLDLRQILAFLQALRKENKAKEIQDSFFFFRKVTDSAWKEITPKE